MKRFLIVAGEFSGEIYGARLMREIRALRPDATFAGIGGDRMKAEGLEVFRHCKEMAVIGLSQMLGRLGFLLGAMDELKEKIRSRAFDAVILIDYAGFNFRMARTAKECGIPVFYYVLPQIWVWRKYRMRAMKKYVDAALSVLPFEPEFYESRGGKATFVGHPMVDEISFPPDPSATKKGFLSAGCDTLVGLMPGSRAGEIRDMLATLVKVTDIIRAKKPNVGFVMPVVQHADLEFIRSVVGGRDFIKITTDGSHPVMAVADLLIAKSGTTALEAALFGVPLVVAYKTRWLSYWAARPFVHLKFAALPNLIMGREVAREFLQANFTAEKVGEYALDLLSNPGRLAEARKEIGRAREKLGEKGAAKRAAEIIVNRLSK